MGKPFTDERIIAVLRESDADGFHWWAYGDQDTIVHMTVACIVRQGIAQALHELGAERRPSKQGALAPQCLRGNALDSFDVRRFRSRDG